MLVDQSQNFKRETPKKRDRLYKSLEELNFALIDRRAAIFISSHQHPNSDLPSIRVSELYFFRRDFALARYFFPKGDAPN
jgi:hypothetical protein